VLVQDPGDATVPSMPESALAAVGAAATVLAAPEIGPWLARLAGTAGMRDDGDVTVPRELIRAAPGIGGEPAHALDMHTAASQ
jgi:hypothetical protein